MTDSRPDTYAHIHLVQRLMAAAIADLQRRQIDHDQTKLVSPELEAYDHLASMKRDGIEYGTLEYRALFRDIKPSIQHHYAHNPHHPEHYERGINDMSLIDVLEMVCDWMAASTRHAPQPLDDWMSINQERFGLSDQLAQIIRATVLLLREPAS